MNNALPAHERCRVRGGRWSMLLLLLLPVPQPAEEPTYPGKTWATRTPAQLGMDVEQLDRFRQYVGGRGCIVRHGYLACTWGDHSKRGDVASAFKPVLAHFLFLALQLGRLSSLDDAVAEFEPGLRELNRNLGFKDRRITWRHLATQTSCYGVLEKPGAAFDYSDHNMALFCDALLLKVYGSTWDKVDRDVLHARLTDPLQCEDRPTFLAFGVKDRPGRLAMSPRDFARFGLLYLRKGTWRGQTLLNEKYAREAISSPLSAKLPRTSGKAAEMIAGQRTIGGGNNQTDHFGSYSFLWWTNGTDRDGQRMWPDAPMDTFGAFGHGGQRALIIIPGLDLVVSYNDASLKKWTSGRDAPTNQALKRLVAAVVK